MNQIRLKLPENTPLLRTIYLYPTDRCNLRCDHCWVAPEQVKNPQEYKEKIGDREISLDLIKETFIKAKDIGLGSVKFTGGEPLLRPETPELMKWFYDQKIRVTVETNGTLIDEEMARKLHEYHVGHISVSIDGPNAEIHDRLRNVQGAFEQACQGVRNLAKYGKHPQIIMSLYTDNEHLIEETVAMAVRLKAGSFKINPVIPSGRALLVQKQSRTIPVKRLMNYYNYIHDVLIPKYRFPIFFSVPTALKRFDEIVNRSAECHIHTICGVMGNGDISICGIGRTEPDLVMGNVAQDDIRDVWINGEIFKYIRENIPKNMKGICSRCIFKGKCLGSCVAITYSMTKELTSGYWFCEEADKIGLFPESRKIPIK